MPTAATDDDSIGRTKVRKGFCKFFVAEIEQNILRKARTEVEIGRKRTI